MTERICSIDGCDQPFYARDWCKFHHQRWRHTGTTDDPVFMTSAERFLAFVHVVDRTSCWEWMGLRDQFGYGSFSIKSYPGKAHRFAYELFVDDIPEGLEIDHLCRNPPCVNPLHLEAVTTQENLRRRGPSGFFREALRTGQAQSHSDTTDAAEAGRQEIPRPA